MQSGSNHKSPIKSSRDSLHLDPKEEADLDRISALTAESVPIFSSPLARMLGALLPTLPSFVICAGGGRADRSSSAPGEAWQLKYPVGDTWRYESSGTTDRQTAKRLLAQKVYLASAGTLPGTATFEQAVELLLNDARVRGLRSIKRLERATRALLARFEGLRAKDVNRSTLVKYAADRQAECTPDTVKFELDVARRALKLAQIERWISDLPEFPRIEHLHVARVSSTDTRMGPGTHPPAARLSRRRRFRLPERLAPDGSARPEVEP